MNKEEIEEELTRLLKRQREIEEDYNYSRDNYHKFIEDGKQKLELLGRVCEGSEHPRAFEVYGKNLKDLIDATDKFQVHGTSKEKASSRWRNGNGTYPPQRK